MTTDDLHKERQGLLHSVEMLQHKDRHDSEDYKTLSRWRMRIEEIDATLYPASTRAEADRVEIALESTLEYSLEAIRKEFGAPAGSCWWFR